MVSTISPDGKIIVINDDPKVNPVKMDNEMKALIEAASNTAIRFDKLVFNCTIPCEVNDNPVQSLFSDYDYRLIGIAGVENKGDEFNLERFIEESITKHRKSPKIN